MGDASNELLRHGYRTVRLLGRNTQDGRETFLCDRLTDRLRVVVKHFSFARRDADWDGFKAHEREIAALRDLSHPAIPRFIDAFPTDDGFCLVQEHKDAQTLGAHRTWRFEEVCQIAEDVLTVLIYLQRRSPAVIHRDLKPDNLLRDDSGRLYLIDFGLAKRLDDTSASTMSAGTPGFMAPEQFFQLPLTAATDLYGLGATLITLLSGVRSSAVAQLVDTSFRFRLDHLDGVAPRWFLGWLEVLVAPELDQRFPDADRALAALHAARQTPERPPTPVPTPRRGSAGALVFSLFLVSAGAAAAGFFALKPELTAPQIPVTTRAPASASPGAVASESGPVSVAPRAAAVRIERGHLTCPPGGASHLRTGEPEVPASLDRVDLDAGCSLELDGLELGQVALAANAELVIRGGQAQMIRVAPNSRLTLEGARVERVVLNGGRVDAIDTEIGRVDASDGARVVIANLRVGELRMNDATAELGAVRIDSYLSLEDSTLRAEGLELATRPRLYGRSVIALDRPMINVRFDANDPAFVVLLRAPVFSQRPRLGRHGRIIGADEAMEPALEALVADRDAALVGAAAAAERAAQIKALERDGCAAVTSCIAQDSAAKGRVEAVFAVAGGVLTVERATRGSECVADRARTVTPAAELHGRLRCGYDVTVDGGARLVSARASKFEPAR